MLNPDHPGEKCPEFWKNNTTFKIREIADTAGSSSDPIPESVAKCRKSEEGTSPGAAMVAASSVTLDRAGVNFMNTGVAVSEEGNDSDVSVKFTQLTPKLEFVAKVSQGWFQMDACQRDEHMRIKNPELWLANREVIQKSNRLDEIRAKRLEYAANIPGLREHLNAEEDAYINLVAPTKIEVIMHPAGPLESELLNDGFEPAAVQTIGEGEEVELPPPPPRVHSSIMANGEGDDIDASWEMPTRGEEEDIDMASSMATVASVTIPAGAASAESVSGVSGDVPRTADPVEASTSTP